MLFSLLHSMATYNFTSPMNPKSLVPAYPNSSSQVASAVSFYPIPKSSFIFPSMSLRPIPKSPAENKGRRLNVVVAALKSLTDTELLVVPPETDTITGIFPSDSGVYAVYDGNGDLQFLGISRNIATSVLAHKKSVPELCSSIKVGTVNEPDREALTQAWKTWMEEHISITGKVPPGNQSGNTTWARQPPKRKADLRLTPGRHVQLTVPLEELIERLVKENRVVAFIKGSRSAPLCGFSQRVVGILESEGVDYESVDVLDEEYNYGLREKLKNYSNWPTFPQIFVDGELVGGCDILTSMHEKGELAALFKK